MGAIVAVAAAQRVRQERELIDHMREHKALSAGAATELRPQRRIGQAVLRRLVRARAVLEAGSGQYWLDEAAYATMRAKRQRTAIQASLIVAVASVAVVAIILLLAPK